MYIYIPQNQFATRNDGSIRSEEEETKRSRERRPTLRPKRRKEEQILVWIGVIAQLGRTRNNRILRETDLPYPHFVLLLHFCHEPDREWTVSSLARAFQRKQPGITKNVRQLLDRGFLRVRPDPTDARVKKLRVTPRGIRARDGAMARLAPAFSDDFGSWKQSEISELHRLVERLKDHLDQQRDEAGTPALPTSAPR